MIPEQVGASFLSFQNLTSLILLIIYSLILIVFVIHQKVKLKLNLEVQINRNGLHVLKSQVSQIKNKLFLHLNCCKLSQKLSSLHVSLH